MPNQGRARARRTLQIACPKMPHIGPNNMGVHLVAIVTPQRAF